MAVAHHVSLDLEPGKLSGSGYHQGLEVGYIVYGKHFELAEASQQDRPFSRFIDFQIQVS